MDKPLRNFLIAGGALIGGAILHHKVKELKKKIKENDRQEPWNTLFYALSRAVVVCPMCKHMAAVKSLDAQLETRWECKKCGCSWIETSHCDVILSKGDR